jgi:DNA-binding transcriptional regulator LsrR (DeoR family)
MAEFAHAPAGPRDHADDGRFALMAAVARRHYLDRRSFVEIAGEYGISRFKVARLIEAARDAGIVRIDVVPRGSIDLERATELRRRFGLRHVVVVDVAGVGVADRRRELAIAAARLLSTVLSDDDVLGVPWSRTVAAMTEYLGELPPVQVVQLTGSMELPDVTLSTVDLVRRIALVAGGGMWRFHAPNLLNDATAAASLRCQPSVADALARAASVTCAVVGVGAWRPGYSSVHDAVDEHTRRAVAATGVVGELACVFFGADGRPRHPDLADRLLAVDAQTFQAIDEVIGIVVYPDSSEVVRAVVREGLVSSLVIGSDLADLLLQAT